MEPFRICASIDIGTNSVLLLVAQLIDGKVKVLHEEQEVPRLGKGVDRDKSLHPESQNRVINVLKQYRNFLGENFPNAVNLTIVTATSAVRDSSNREEFLNWIQRETGWTVRLLSGEEEARTTYSGAVSVLAQNSGQFTVLDIGGGSTEIAMGVESQFKNGISLDMGSVRFSERFLKHDPPLENEIDLARKEIYKVLLANSLESIPKKLIGVAGTVTSLAAILLGLKSYKADKVNGFILKRSKVSEFIRQFTNMTSGDIEVKYSPFLKGRGDVITGGILILEEFMKFYDFSELIVSTGGIRHGILLDKKKGSSPADR